MAERLVFFVRDGEMSNNTLRYLLESKHKPEIVLIERRDKKAEIKTYINTQGYYRFLLFIIRSVLLRPFKKSSKKANKAEDICDKYGVTYEIVKSHSGKKSKSIIAKIAPSLGVICAARIISKELIEAFPKGIINCHPGWLPDYRGWDALRWSVYKNKNIGITAHLISPEVDAGPIIKQLRLESKKVKSFKELYSEALKQRQFLLSESIQMVSESDFIPIQQNPAEGKRYYRMNYFQMIIVNLRLYLNYRK